jgi:hypothetical protein
MNILEGSVQKANDQVRVNVQLINALTDAHLWADTYDRKLIDIFSVESDIAKTIADTLQAKLTGSEKRAITVRPTENTEAYQLYLKGRFFWNKRTAGDLRTAADYFQQAIAVDPSYASAYAGLAQAELLIPVFGGGAPRDFFPKAISNLRNRRRSTGVPLNWTRTMRPLTTGSEIACSSRWAGLTKPSKKANAQSSSIRSRSLLMQTWAAHS